MPSLVWGRDPQEAFEEPYEYGIQEQFHREAERLFTELYKLLNGDRHHYSMEDRSREKAIWLLAVDVLDSLRGCLQALVRKDHRVAGVLFRAVMEPMDLAAYFHGTAKSKADLEKWYTDEVIPHRRYRDYVKTAHGSDTAELLAKHYHSLSRFTHRSYRAILDGYLQGREGRLVHDSIGEIFGHSDDGSKVVVLPQTIASYYAVLANLTLEYTSQISEFGLVSQESVESAFASSLESKSIPRRFFPRRWLAERLNRHVKKNGAG